MTEILAKAPEILAAVLSIIGAAATIASVFSAPLAAKLGVVGDKLRKVVNLLGMNVGAAKNAEEK